MKMSGRVLGLSLALVSSLALGAGKEAKKPAAKVEKKPVAAEVKKEAKPAAEAKGYKVDVAHSSVTFTVKHLVISKVKGTFKDFQGEFKYNPGTKAVESAEGTVNVLTIDTNEKDRDKHLLSKDFFDTDASNADAPNNKISFKLNKFEGGKAKGDITIKGITKPIELKVEIGGTVKDPWGNERMAFAADGRINRKDFGLNWNKALETGGFVVSDEVDVHVEVEGVVK